MDIGCREVGSRIRKIKNISAGHGIEKRKDPEMKLKNENIPVLCGLYAFIAQDRVYRKLK